MLTISGAVAAVSVFVVVIVSAVLIRQKYELENDFHSRMSHITQQVNEANTKAADFDNKQQLNIRGIENDYVRKADQSKLVKTDFLDAKTTRTDSLETQTASSVMGLLVKKDNPGPLVEKVYNNDLSNRYGVGNFNTSTRVYAAAADKDSTIDMGFANKDGTFRDVLTVRKENDNNIVGVNGDLLLNDRYRLVGTKSGSINLMDKEGKSFNGGLSLNNIDVRSNGVIKHASMTSSDTENANARSLYAKNGTFGDLVADNSSKFHGPAHFNNDITTNGKLTFGKDVVFESSKDGLSTRFAGPATASYKVLNGIDPVHEFNMAGMATHKGMKLSASPASAMEFEAGLNEGLSAINFNGKSRWRAAVDQRGKEDAMFFEQTAKDGKKTTYMTLSNNAISTRGPFTIDGGSLTQKTDVNSGAWTMGSSGDEGIIAYDGASFSFGNKGTKMITLNANTNTIGLSAKVDINHALNVKGDLLTPAVWLGDKVGISMGPAGALSVMSKETRELSGLSAKELRSDTSVVGKGGIAVQGQSTLSDLTVDGVTTIEKGMTTPNVWLVDNIGIGKTPSGAVGIMNMSRALGDIEMKKFTSQGGTIGDDGVVVDGFLHAKSDVKFDGAANVKGDVITPNVWLSDKIGFGMTPSSSLGVIDKASRGLADLQARQLGSEKAQVGTGGIFVEGDGAIASNFTVEGVTNAKGGLNTQYLLLDDKVRVFSSGINTMNVADKEGKLTDVNVGGAKVGDKGFTVAGDSAFASSLTVERATNAKGGVNTPNVLLGDKVKIEPTPTGALGVMTQRGGFANMELEGVKIGANGLNVTGATTLGRLTAKSGFSFLDGDGQLMIDSQGNLIATPKANSGMLLGRQDMPYMVIGPSDTSEIKIGKNGAFVASADGNTIINPHRVNGKILVGSREVPTSSVVLGENALENKIGTEAKMNMVGKSMFPSLEGDVNIRPSQTGKRVMIGTDTDVTSVNIGMRGSVVNVRDTLCIDDACISKNDINTLKSLTAQDIQALKNLSSTPLWLGPAPA